MAGVNGVSALQVLPFGGKGRSFNFDYNLAIAGGFVAGMAKRLPPAGPFAAAPIIQGKWDGSGTPDVVTFPRGAQIGNLTGFAYANFDPYQGTISFWITPEWAGGDGLEHDMLGCSSFWFYKSTGDILRIQIGGQTLNGPSVAGWVAGTTYHVVFSWSCQRTIDGTDYMRISANNAHTYGVTTQPTPAAPGATISVGGYSFYTSQALIQGLVISRRVWTDSNGYGDSVGNGADEIGQVYAAGAGKDWALINGSWDTMASLPTDSTVGALVTSATQMWSHPHASSVPDVTMCRDGGYLGSPFAVELNGTSSRIDCGTGATLDDLGAGGATFQVECFFRHDTATAGTYVLLSKGWAALTGWSLYINSSGYLTGVVDLVTTDSTPSLATSVRDGKWHHGVLSYNDTTKNGYTALDGVWSAASLGNGNYVADNALSLYMGRRSDSAVSYMLGAMGWSRIHNHAHYTPGTDFVPPRVNPGSDAGTVERWDADEGTLAVLNAHVTTPANDGAMANCTWSGVWQPVATPVVPTSLQCDGVATYGNAGLGGAIDNLADAEFTVDGWFRLPKVSADVLISKGLYGSRGWYIQVTSTGIFQFNIYCATTASYALPTVSVMDNCWHYFSAHWNDAGGADRKAHLSLDGLPVIVGTLGVGAIVADAADNMLVGRRTDAAIWFWAGAISWLRISNNDRNAMVSGPGVKAFCPIDRVNPPAADANTLWQCNFNTGAGLLAPNVVAPGTNDVVITMDAGKWLNTIDMAQDAPGERVFNWGYKFGSSAAGDGLTIRDIGVTASQDYVVRVVTHADPRSQPYIQMWDMIGAAQIGADYFLPRRYGQHTGANNSATLICATGYFWQQLIGWRVYNITDGSWTTITAVSGDRTTITGVLAGGTDNDWDTNDYYMLMPPTGKHESQYPYATETIHVIRTPVGCTSMECRIINNSTGVIGLHQFEVQPSLLINGDHETLDGVNPELITGWTTTNLDAGDTEPEATTVHAGIRSLEWNSTADAEYMYYAPVTVSGGYYGIGAWIYGEGVAARSPRLRTVAGYALAQYSTSVVDVVPASGVAAWFHVPAVLRATHAAARIVLHSGVGVTGDRWTDDIYMIALTPITLTVTPASAVNSAEGTGIRIDGYDRLPQPSDGSILRANSGKLTVYVTPRHNVALASGFGSVYESIVTLYQDANNYIYIRMLTNLMRLVYRANGGAVVTTDWAPGVGGWIVGTKYKVELRYNNAYVDVWVDNVRRIHVVGGVLFAAAFTNPTLWGTDDVYVNQASMVLSAS